MDRQIVRGMVEDLWRSFIPAMQRQDTVSAEGIGARFEKLVNATAAELPPLERAAFLQAVETERDLMIDEYQRDPVGLKRRLGISLGVDDPRFRPTPTYRGSGMGELVVRTAVRATIWEAIWKLFR